MADTMIDVDDQRDSENKSQLQFQDIPHEEKTGKKKVQTHTFTSFPPTALSDDEEEDHDKSELLRGEKKAPSFWTFEYYQQFFDVDTKQVFWRILGSFLPHPRKNYLQKYIRPNPDLYGPFWICTTLVFTTAIAGNMANYLQSGGKDYQWRYDFHKVTFAATAIFCYWWLIPTFLFGLLWFRKSEAGYTFLEIISVYGYSLAIYVPISILWVIQVNWIQWLLVIIGACLSGGVLLLTFWPAVREDNKRLALVTMILIFICHALLAVGFVLYFFHVPQASSSPILINSTTTESVVHHNKLQMMNQQRNLPVSHEKQNVVLSVGPITKVGSQKAGPNIIIAHTTDSPKSTKTAHKADKDSGLKEQNSEKKNEAVKKRTLSKNKRARLTLDNANNS